MAIVLASGVLIAIATVLNNGYLVEDIDSKSTLPSLILYDAGDALKRRRFAYISLRRCPISPPLSDGIF